MTIKLGNSHFLPYAINATDLAAGTSREHVSPIDGYIVAVDGIVQEAIVTGGAITFAVGTTAVAGASVTFADAAAKGSKGTVVQPTAKSPTQRVLKGQRIQVIPAAAFNGGGAVNGVIQIDAHASADAAVYGG